MIYIELNYYVPYEIRVKIYFLNYIERDPVASVPVVENTIFSLIQLPCHPCHKLAQMCLNYLKSIVNFETS